MIRPSTAWLIAVTLLGGMAVDVRAALILDPKPALTWKEMLDCELVVVGRYKGHKGKTLTLEVDRVLKGKGVKAGTALDVALEHWYSVETGTVGIERLLKKKVKEGPPRLCYQEQITNPGPLVPVPILKDVHGPAIYFLSRAARPALQRRGQVQEATGAEAWENLLAGRPADLFFRLRQRVSEYVRRAALEELHETRDRPTFEKLFKLLSEAPDPLEWPPERSWAQSILCQVGDKEGDVYDRALKLLTAENGDLVLPLLARVDARRAGPELRRLMREGSPALKDAVAGALGYLRNDEGLAMALALLDDPAQVERGIGALRRMLQDDHRTRWQPPAALKEKAVPALKATLASGRLDKKQQQALVDAFRFLIGAPPVINLEQAEKLLCDPANKWYEGPAGEADRLLADINDALDPRCLPLLVRILHLSKLARMHGSMDAAVKAYASWRPNAFRRELSGHTELLPLAAEFGYSDVRDPLCHLLNMPRALHHARGLRSPPPAEPAPWELLLALKEHALERLREDGTEDASYLAGLLTLDLTEGSRVLEDAVALAAKGPPTEQEAVLELALKYGQRLELELLLRVGLRRVEPLNSGRYARPDEDLGRFAPDLPLLAQSLKELDAARVLHESGDRDEPLNDQYRRKLRSLYPRHPDAFMERVLALLASSVETQRRAGEECLDLVFHCRFGYRSDAFAAERTETLVQLRPKLTEWARLGDVGRHVAVLGELGLALAGEPSDAWLPTLDKAALSFDDDVAWHAMSLISHILKAPKPEPDFAGYPRWKRQRQLDAWRQDRKETPPSVALSVAESQAVWADLAAEGKAGYFALARLRRAPPDQALTLIRKHVRPATAVDPARIARRLADVDSPVFTIRHKATLELEQEGDLAIPFVRQVLGRGGMTLEVERRLRALLAKLEGWGPYRLRHLRVINALEHLPAREAEQILADLATGVPEAWLTRQARAALERRRERGEGTFEK